jgi:hypothetical protein
MAKAGIKPVWFVYEEDSFSMYKEMSQNNNLGERQISDRD